MQIRHTPLSGGYCGGVPPLPIPNREVKPTCADGTAMQCGRVGRRLLSMKSLRFRKISEAFLSFFPRIFFFSAGVLLFHRDFFIGFSSSDFTDESEGNLAYRITHGFSRIFGRWSMARARHELLLFLSRRFGFPFGRRFPIRRWRRFFLIDYFVPQISRIYTDYSLVIFFFL